VLFMRLAILTAVLSIAALSPSTAHAAGYAEDGTYYTDADIEAAIHASFESYDWATADQLHSSSRVRLELLRRGHPIRKCLLG
jgi:hypothetical protein